MGHMKWKLLRKKIMISAYKYSYKIEKALDDIEKNYNYVVLIY